MNENENENENDVTDATVEQELLSNILLTLTSADPNDYDLDNTHTAVATYEQFQDALLVKAQRYAINS